MNKMFKTVAFTIILLLVALSSVCMASSSIMPISDNPLARTGEPTPTNEEGTNGSISILNTDLYAADNSVVVENVVNGNAFVYGQSVTIKGQINGDLFVAGNLVTIDKTAQISGNVFAFANMLSFSGTAGNLYAFGQAFTLENGSSILKDLRLYANTISLNGIVGRDAHIIGNSVIFSENATNVIRGNLYYSATNEAAIPEGAVVGKTEFTPITTEAPTVAQLITTYITSFVNVLAYAIIVILLASYIAPNFAKKASYCMEKKPFVSAGIGILAFVLVPFASIICLITGFLTYIGMALLALYVLMLSITISILGMAIGNYIAGKLKNNTKWKSILLSISAVAVIWLLQLIPAIGTWISIFTVVFGFGILLFSLFMRKDVSELTK